MKWYYTDGQLRTMYRDAKDRRAQIGIIAELEAKPPELVVEKLESLGEVVELGKKQRKNQKRNGHVTWSEEEDRILREAWQQGKTLEQIAELLPGRSAKAVGNRREKMHLKGRKRDSWWTEEEDNILREASRSRTSISELQKLLPRTKNAIIQRRHVLKLPKLRGGRHGKDDN